MNSEQIRAEIARLQELLLVQEAAEQAMIAGKVKHLDTKAMQANTAPDNLKSTWWIVPVETSEIEVCMSNWIYYVRIYDGTGAGQEFRARDLYCGDTEADAWSSFLAAQE